MKNLNSSSPESDINQTHLGPLGRPSGPVVSIWEISSNQFHDIYFIKSSNGWLVTLFFSNFVNFFLKKKKTKLQAAKGGLFFKHDFLGGKFFGRMSGSNMIDNTGIQDPTGILFKKSKLKSMKTRGSFGGQGSNRPELMKHDNRLPLFLNEFAQIFPY